MRCFIERGEVAACGNGASRISKHLHRGEDRRREEHSSAQLPPGNVGEKHQEIVEGGLFRRRGDSHRAEPDRLWRGVLPFAPKRGMAGGVYLCMHRKHASMIA